MLFARTFLLGLMLSGAVLREETRAELVRTYTTASQAQKRVCKTQTKKFLFKPLLPSPRKKKSRPPRSRVKQYEAGESLLGILSLLMLYMLGIFGVFAAIAVGGFWAILGLLATSFLFLGLLGVGIWYAILLLDHSLLLQSEDKIANWDRIKLKTLLGLIFGGVLFALGLLIGFAVYPFLGALAFIYAAMSLPMLINNLYERITQKPNKDEKKPQSGY
jgi:hypothetical protein